MNILTLFLTLSASTFGQFNKLKDAIFYLQNGDLDKAKTLIDQASEDTAHADKTITHYYRGYIYKELFKEREKNEYESNYRKEAAKSLTKVVEKDDKPELTQSSKKMLTYLAATYFNQINKLLAEEKFEHANTSFERFIEISKTADPTKDLSERRIDFKASLGDVYTNRFLSNKTDTNKHYFEKARDLYLEVLAIDSNNFHANYNLGILYFNQGVDIINNMDYDLDLEKLNAIQDKTIDLFMKALPYMKKSYQLKPHKKEPIKGLSQIYLSLNENEKSKAFKEKLEKLEEEEDNK